MNQPGHGRCFVGRGIVAVALLSACAVAARSDEKGKPPEDTTPKVLQIPTPPPKPRLKEPVESRVYQRGADGHAEIPIELEKVKGTEDARVAKAQVVGGSSHVRDGKLIDVPTGGPYTINVECADKQPFGHKLTVPNVFVGDLWILAGQSNMEGNGNLVDVSPPNDEVRLLGMDDRWSRAEEPLHWLVDSPDPVHSGNPADRAARSAEYHKRRNKGAGLGLAFASELARVTGVPIGLIATAHGGTSLGQWSPAQKDKGGESLYGSMLRSVKLAGGKVKGMLWYQGESDASNADAAKHYEQAFTDFIAAARADIGQPDLPVYFVQIGRFVNGGSPKGWNSVQEAQRLVAERVPNTAVVASIDLELDDGIHISTPGLQRLGHRLARVAERELFGRLGATTPTLDRVNKGPGNTLVVKFKGVNLGHEPAGAGMGGVPHAQAGQGMMSVPIEVAQFGGGGGRMMGGGQGVPATARQQGHVVGLKPSRHIAGFSIRDEKGDDVPLIFDAAVGQARDTVILKLNRAVPPKSSLYYGYGFDPYCNLVDSHDMAVPVFGPVALDDVK